MKNQSQVFLAIAAMMMATLFVGGATPVSADPTGTTFFYQSSNFQGELGVHPAVPFGTPTSVNGMTINTMATPLPSIPELGIPEGSELIQFSFNTDNGGFLADSTFGNTQIFVDGLNWGENAPPAVAVGFAFLSFDKDGEIQELTDGVPSPFSGNSSAPIDVDGAPADTFLIDFFELVGAPLSLALGGVGVEDPTGAQGGIPVNSMHLELVVTHIPEPGSLALFGCGLALVALHWRKR